MASPLTRLLLLGFTCSLLASAEEIPISMSTGGSFSQGTRAGLTFAGIGNTRTSGFDAITIGGGLALPNLGTFTLRRPTQGADPYNNDFFTLNLIFFAPNGVIGETSFNGELHGVANRNRGSVSIHFGPTQSFLFENASATGGFQLTLDDLALDLPDGANSVSQMLTGTITNAYDPPIDASSIPEPMSVVLLGSVMLLISGRIRQQSRKI